MHESSYKNEDDADVLNLLAWITIILFSAYRLYVLYFPFKLFGYLVPPGSDPVNHYDMVQKVLSGNFNVQYPLLFHTLIAFISRLFSANPIDVMKYIGPFLVILPPIAIYLFLKNNFGRLVGIVGFVIAALASNYGLLAFADGNYPNMLSGGFLMPLALMFLIYATKKRDIKNYIWGLVIGVLMVLTHQLTVALFAIIMIVYLVTVWLWNTFEPDFKGLKRLTYFVVGFLIVGVAIIFLSPVKDLFMKVLGSIFSGGFVDDVAYLKPLEYSDYQYSVGALVWTGGLISIIYIFFLLGKRKEEGNKAALLLILVWFAVCFALSRMSQTGMPGRFSREMAIPLIMALAISIVAIIRQNGNTVQKVLASGFFGFIIVVNLVQVNGGAFSAPDYFKNMIWFDQQDKEKADYFKAATNTSDIIISNRTTPYMPIFAERQVVYDVEDFLKRQTIYEYFANVNAKYLFIGPKTLANPDPKSYPFFKEFDNTTLLLREVAERGGYDVVHQFADGAVLFKIE